VSVRADWSLQSGLWAITRCAASALSLLPLLCALGCRTFPPLPAVNLSEPGWTVRTGQAVWRPKHETPEIAGDLLLATNPDGRRLVQFTKTPLALIIAQITTNSWQIESPAQGKRYSGPGQPPARVIWFQLSSLLAGAAPPEGWVKQTLGEERWRLENRATGEVLEGYLTQ